MECYKLYMTGAVTLVTKELAKYRLDLVGAQEVRKMETVYHQYLITCYTMEKEIITN